MLAGFRRLSIGIMWYVEVMVRGMFIQRFMLRDVVVAGVGCALFIKLDGQAAYINMAVSYQYPQTGSKTDFGPWFDCKDLATFL
jgi:hypothetical protein